MHYHHGCVRLSFEEWEEFGEDLWRESFADGAEIQFIVSLADDEEKGNLPFGAEAVPPDSA